MAQKDPILHRLYDKRYRETHKESRRAAILRWNEEHKECYLKHKRDYAKKRRESDREAWRARNRIYDRARRARDPAHAVFLQQKRRARKKGSDATLTEDQWLAILKSYKYKCAYCGKREKLTQDHVIPLSRGGRHSSDNVVPACRSCNGKKGDRPAPFIPAKRLML